MAARRKSDLTDLSAMSELADDGDGRVSGTLGLATMVVLAGTAPWVFVNAMVETRQGQDADRSAEQIDRLMRAISAGVREQHDAD